MICPIPPMTDLLGRHWEAPSVEEIVFDYEYAYMTKKTFDKLGEYSTTLPSATYAGKMWKTCIPKTKKSKLHWRLRWYEDHPTDPKKLLIPSRRIVICKELPVVA